MDRDGTKDGYDIAITREVAAAVSIPVIASGGAGTLEHFYEAVTFAAPARAGGVTVPFPRAVRLGRKGLSRRPRRARAAVGGWYADFADRTLIFAAKRTSLHYRGEIQ